MFHGFDDSGLGAAMSEAQTRDRLTKLEQATPPPAEVKISRRDYFAGLAMQSLLAGQGSKVHEILAQGAVKYADALLTELGK